MPSKGGSCKLVFAIKLGRKHLGCGIEFHKPSGYPTGGRNGERCRRICQDICRMIKRRKADQEMRASLDNVAEKQDRESIMRLSSSDTDIWYESDGAEIPSKSASFHGLRVPGLQADPRRSSSIVNRSILRDSEKSGPKKTVSFLARMEQVKPQADSTTDENEMAEDKGEQPGKTTEATFEESTTSSDSGSDCSEDLIDHADTSVNYIMGSEEHAAHCSRYDGTQDGGDEGMASASTSSSSRSENDKHNRSRFARIQDSIRIRRGKVSIRRSRRSRSKEEGSPSRSGEQDGTSSTCILM